MSVLLSRRFALLTALAGIGRLQNTMIGISLIAVGVEQGLPAWQSSAMGGALFLTAALSAIGKGRAVDLYGHRIVAGQAVLSIALIMSIAASILIAPWWLSALLAAALGAVRINPGALQQANWALAHKDQGLLERALSMETLIGILAQTAGPLLSAAFIFFVGGWGSLLFAGILASTSMFCWGLIAPSAKQEKSSEKSRVWRVWRIAAAMFSLSLLAGINQGLLVLVKGPSQGALLIAAFTFGAGLTSAFFIWKGFTPERWRRQLIVFSPLFFAGVYLLFEFSIPLVAALLLAGSGFAATAIAVNSTVREEVGRGSLNEGFSVVLLGNISGVSLGLFLSGVIAGHLLVPLLIVAVACLFNFFFSSRERKNGVSASPANT